MVVTFIFEGGKKPEYDTTDTHVSVYPLPKLEIIIVLLKL